jgi:hypothetical protein
MAALPTRRRRLANLCEHLRPAHTAAAAVSDEYGGVQYSTGYPTGPVAFDGTQAVWSGCLGFGARRTVCEHHRLRLALATTWRLCQLPPSLTHTRLHVRRLPHTHTRIWPPAYSSAVPIAVSHQMSCDRARPA